MSHVSRFDCLGGRQSGGCGNGVHHVPASLRLFGPCRHWGTPGTRPLPGWFGSVGSTATHAGRGSRWANCCLKGHQREVGTVVDRRGDARANRRAEDRRPHAKRLEKRFAVGPSSELVPSKRTFPIGSHLSGGWATNHHKRLTRFLPWTRSEGSCVATSVNPASHAQDAPRETFLAPVGDFDGRSARLCGRTRLLLVGSGVAGRRAAYQGLSAGHRHRVGRRVTFSGTDLDRVASMDRARDEARVSAAGHQGGRQLGPSCSVLIRAPFVMGGDLSERQLERCYQETIRPAADALTTSYLAARPDRPITVLLFAGQESYREAMRGLFGEKNPPHFGSYRSHLRVLALDFSTGCGTIVHELTHALVRGDFRSFPIG